MKGYTKLELLRDNKVVHRVEKHNTPTGFLENASGRGNFHLMANVDKIIPVMNWYNGCILTDSDNDATQLMIAGNSNVTACGGNDAYGGTYSPRGSFNQIESGAIANGYRFVWDWNTAQGNGAIKSVCLTRSLIGKTEIREAGIDLTDNIPVNEYFGDTVTITSDLKYCSIIDYEKESGYRIDYDTNEQQITVSECKLNTKLYHITGNRFDIIEGSWEDHVIQQQVQRWNTDSRCVTYSINRDKIHLITWRTTVPSESDLSERNLFIYTIDTSTWDCTATSYRFNDVAFQATWGASIVARDVMLIINNYVWALAQNGEKIVQCNLSNQSDITEYDNPLGAGSVNRNGCCCVFPNGDWYKFGKNDGGSTYNLGIYYHNGAFYKCTTNSGSGTYDGIYGVHVTPYGTQLRSTAYGTTCKLGLFTSFPYVSTVNNLDSAIIKTTNVTMKLTYDITET